MNNTHAALLVAVMAVFTMLLRFLPFLLFRKKTPPYIAYLGEVLPAAIIGMLVIYCLKDVRFGTAAGWLPALAGVAVTAVLHAWRRNIMLSIISGTLVYMLLIRIII